MTPGSLANRRGIRTILAGSGLAGLLGATACAVASVSGWLVPVYLLAVAVILAAPRGRSSAASCRLPVASRQPTGAGTDSPLAEPESSGASPETAIAEPPPVSSSPATDNRQPATGERPRKSRARARKTARTADSPGPVSAPVTWVRVGPGQYVRSDTIPQGHAPVAAQAPAEAPPPAEAQADAEVPPAVEAPASTEAPPPPEAPPPAGVTAVAARGDPVTDQSEPAADEPAAPIEAGPAAEVPEADAPVSEEPATCAQPATVEPVAETVPTPGGEATEAPPTVEPPGMEPTATEVVPVVDPVAEEYGIAPSALGPTAPAPERLTSDSPEEGVLEPIEPIALNPDPGQIDDLGATVPESDPAVAVTSHRRRGPGTSLLFVPRSLISRSRARDPVAMPSRRDVRGPGRPRVTVRVRGSSTRDPRQAGDARRACGRSEYLRHAWRARSPPGSS